MPETQAISCIFYIHHISKIHPPAREKQGEEEAKTHHQCPTPRKPGPILPIDEHHVRYNPHIMLPPMSQLMPPLLLNHLALVNLINRPHMPVALIQENALKDMILVWYGRFIRIVIQSELMLVVGAIERHLDLVRVLGVGVRVVHRPIPGRLVIRSLSLVFRERDLLFLLLGLRFRAQLGVEARLEVLLEVVAV